MAKKTSEAGSFLESVLDSRPTLSRRLRHHALREAITGHQANLGVYHSNNTSVLPGMKLPFRTRLLGGVQYDKILSNWYEPRTSPSETVLHKEEGPGATCITPRKCTFYSPRVNSDDASGNEVGDGIRVQFPDHRVSEPSPIQCEHVGHPF